MENSRLTVHYKYSVEDLFVSDVESVTVYESKKVAAVKKTEGTVHVEMHTVAAIETNKVTITYLP